MDAYTKAEVDAKLSSVYKFKGSVANVEALPTDAVVGDTYNVEDTGANYAWDGSNWDKLSDTIDLSDYATKEDLSGYLPLGGGTLTGPLTIVGDGFASNVLLLKHGDSGAVHKVFISEGGIQIPVRLNNMHSIYPSQFDGPHSLGTDNLKWDAVYTTKLNNGEDLIVPTEGGTLARLEDLEGLGGGAEIGPELDVELKLTSWFYGFNSSDGYFYFDNIYGVDSPEDLSCFALTNKVYSGSPHISIVNRSYGAFEDGEHYSFTEEWFGPGAETYSSYPKTLGRDNAPWKTLYVESLCAQGGEELLLPTEGGTLARLEDLEGLGGGDYLPLSGGEMTGLLILNGVTKPQYSYEPTPFLRINAETEGGSVLTRDIGVSQNGSLFFGGFKFYGLGTLNPQSSSETVGSTLLPWLRIYVKKINNGADIAIPTEGGTLARVEDITAAIGDINTILDNINGEVI